MIFFLSLFYFFFHFFLLEYSCFTMLCQFLLYSKVNQLYVYMYPLFFRFPSHLGHHQDRKSVVQGKSVDLGGRRIIKKNYYFLIFKNFYWSIVDLQCQFQVYSKVNQLYVYMYPLFFRFPSQLGYHRSLSRVLCAIHQVLISYLFYIHRSVYMSSPCSCSFGLISVGHLY